MSLFGKGVCRGCGDRLLPNALAGYCPPCRWEWPVFSEGNPARILAEQRAGISLLALGMRMTQNSDTQEVLHRMKYGSLPTVGRELGHWMAMNWQPPKRSAVLVPVPLHRRRKLRRGFNPSQALAEGLSKGWNLEVCVGLLERIRHGKSLTASGRSARMDWIQHAYAVRSPRDRGPCDVLLVDDVLTTGATVHACRKQLEAAGHRVLGGAWLAMA